MIEYIRKNGSNKGLKKGVVYCGIDPDNPQGVVVGFTLCNNIDRFDYINDVHVKDFGVDTAKIRAGKWNKHSEFFIQNTFTEAMIDNENLDLICFINPNKSEVVELPPSVVGKLRTFIGRCRRYYKNKVFPAWVEKFEKKEPFPEDELKMESVRICFEF